MAPASQLLSALLLCSPAAVAAETVLGLYVFHRHGDRTAKAWTPVSLTSLGADQVFASASWYRAQYIGPNAASPVHALEADVPVLSQLSVTAPIDNVLQNSANVFVQGLYPPAGAASSQKLANGTSVESPLGGYQYIPVNAVANAASNGGSEDNEWLQANSGCGNALVSSNNYFLSDDYLATLNSTGDFYKGLLPVVNGTYNQTQATFKNAYTIYDLIHVATIHNTTINGSDLLTDPALHQLATRADQHEWGLAYNATDTARAIAGAVLAAQIVQALNTSLAAPASKASAQRLTIQFGAYATFMSFFGLAGLPAASPDFVGIVDYASSIVFELVTNATLGSGPVSPADASVRFRFVNGSAAAGHEPATFPLFGGPDTLLPWANFTSQMQKFAVGDTASWCKACGNITGVCAASATGSGSGSGSGSDSGSGGGGGGLSPAVAGIIGAMVTLVVILGIEAIVMLLAGLRLVKKSAGKGASPSAS